MSIVSERGTRPDGLALNCFSPHVPEHTLPPFVHARACCVMLCADLQLSITCFDFKLSWPPQFLSALRYLRGFVMIDPIDLSECVQAHVRVCVCMSECAIFVC